jgi:hypothetical protein
MKTKAWGGFYIWFGHFFGRMFQGPYLGSAQLLVTALLKKPRTFCQYKPKDLPHYSQLTVP